MSFYENVMLEINAGILKEPFSAADVKALRPLPEGRFQVGQRDYPASTIDSYFSNNSFPGGAAVKNGAAPKFLRVNTEGALKYISIKPSDIDSEMIIQRIQLTTPAEDVEEFDEIIEQDVNYTDHSGNGERNASTFNINSIYDQFVDYIANKPFRIYSYEKRGYWYPSNGPSVGWQQRLNNYLWNGANWLTTFTSLNTISSQLGSLLSTLRSGGMPTHGSASHIFSQVAKWGGTNPGQVSNTTVVAALMAVDNYINSKPLPNKPPMSSTWTKVYALAFPNDFVIYDTRVAAAIVSIAEDIYRRNNSANNGRGIEANIDDFRFHFKHIGEMKNASRGGTRPRGTRYRLWPAAYKSWDAQTDANTLCKGIKDSLNRQNIDGRSNWTLREVEAVLFMEGY